MKRTSILTLIFAVILAIGGFSSCKEADKTNDAKVSGLHIKEDKLEQWLFMNDSSLVVTIMFENNLLDSIRLPMTPSALVSTKSNLYEIAEMENLEAMEHVELIFEDGRAFVPKENESLLAKLKSWDEELGITQLVNEELKKKAKEKLNRDQNEKALSISTARVHNKHIFYRQLEDVQGAIRENVRTYDEGNKGRAIRNLLKLGNL